MGIKRSHAEMKNEENPPATTPISSMFEHFRAELDEHHDRRERIIKASRDITAASKKIIFTLQRIRKINQPLPPHVHKNNKPYYDTIRAQFSSVAKDLQGLDAARYARQISGGCQEYIEAASFEHYLTHASLLTYDEAVGKVGELSRVSSSAVGEVGDVAATVASEEGSTPSSLSIRLSEEDYLLGIYDMTGELMRFGITAMATEGALPSIQSQNDSDNTNNNAMDTSLDEAERIPGAGTPKDVVTDRNVLSDLRALRTALEGLNAGGGPFGKEVGKKAEVMRTSVEKVERALYGLTVRGAERPKGWMPEMGGGRTVEVES